MPRTTYGPDSDYLRMTADGDVFLCSPGGSSAPLGHIASPRTDDACPEPLRDDLATLYREFVEGLIATPGCGRLPLVRRSRVPA